VREAAALLREPRLVSWIAHVGQPQDDRSQPTLALGGAVAGDPVARRGRRIHVPFHVTRLPVTFKPFAAFV
jgi:hypothetical protein